MQFFIPNEYQKLLMVFYNNKISLISVLKML